MENITREDVLNDKDLKGSFYGSEYTPFVFRLFEKFSLYKDHPTTASGSVAAPKDKTPQEAFIEKSRMTSMIHVMNLLVNKCLQWEQGKLRGFDRTMFESLLPITLQPFTTDSKSELASLRQQLKEREDSIKEFLHLTSNWKLYTHADMSNIRDRAKTLLDKQ